jgi:chromosome segregation ATPase
LHIPFDQKIKDQDKEIFKMSIISTGYRALSGIVNLGKHVSPATGAMLAAAAAASGSISPVPRALLLGGTLLGAYYNAKQDIQIETLKSSLSNMDGALQKLEHLSQQVKDQVPGLKDVCNKVDGLMPKVDARLSEQEKRLVRIGNSLKTIKEYQNGFTSLGGTLENLHKQEIQLVEHVGHFQDLTNKQQDFRRSMSEQLAHWDSLAKELEQFDGMNHKGLVQEIRQEIHNLTQAVNRANVLKQREIEVIDRYNCSNPQERAQVAAKLAFQPKVVHSIPLIGDRVN